jgi:hypothetical protein
MLPFFTVLCFDSWYNVLPVFFFLVQRTWHIHFDKVTIFINQREGMSQLRRVRTRPENMSFQWIYRTSQLSRPCWEWDRRYGSVRTVHHSTNYTCRATLLQPEPCWTSSRILSLWLRDMKPVTWRQVHTPSQGLRIRPQAWRNLENYALSSSH